MLNFTTGKRSSQSRVIFYKIMLKIRIWSRSVCINENLELGSQIPYIEAAVKKGFSVILLNPNENKNSGGEPIKFNSSPKDHCRYVWENIIMKKCSAKSLRLLAFSNGGVCAHDLMTKYSIFFGKNTIKNRKRFYQ